MRALKEVEAGPELNQADFSLFRLDKLKR